MSDTKDPAIKLFGKTIPVAECPATRGGAPEASSSSSTTVLVEDNRNITAYDNANNSRSTDQDEENSNKDGDEDDRDDGGGGDYNNDDEDSEKDVVGEPTAEAKEQNIGQSASSDDIQNSDSASGATENPKTSSVEDNASPKVSKTEEDERSEGTDSQEKTLKKPDKILPCPRCNSMDTKFCYYNNYNVNQPRHFCKNCQRYWTAGGTMRNVPVGAGRRKNKNSVSQYRHIAVSESFQNARPDVVHHNSYLKPNGTVLTFGGSPDAPLCESTTSVLKLADKTMNGFHKTEEMRIASENGDASLNGSSVVTSNPKDEACETASQEQVMSNCQNFPPQMPCFPGAPWPYLWNSAQCSSPVPMPAFCPPGFPMPFYPAAAYWGYSVPGAWNVPWPPQPSSPSTLAGTNFGPNSPTLGKHSREESTAQKPSYSAEEQTPEESNSERSLWIPKTLRIDDPGEAARSSIWATLGIKNDKADAISGGGLFRSFRPKNGERKPIAEASKVLRANPAALSRSVRFLENL